MQEGNFCSGEEEVCHATCFLERLCRTMRKRIGRCVSRGALAMFVLSAWALAENCTMPNDMDAATRTAMTTAAQHDFDLIAKGDMAALRQTAVPSVASDFAFIENRVKDNQAALAGSKASARAPFLLEADGTAPIPHAEFFCGVFGAKGQTQDSAIFYLNNLPPGKYGVVILDAPSPKGARTVSFILQQMGAEWKLGNLFIKRTEYDGHDSAWFAGRAHDYQSKGQTHVASLYAFVALSLASPLPFMSTAATDNLYDQAQKMQASDFPSDGKPVDLTTASGTYKLTAIFPDLVGDDLDLVVKYEVKDVSNTTASYQSNVAVMKGLLAKYPELRDAFSAVVARATTPSGQDYGTLLAMKDIK
jgi:hypothetical protein